MDTTLAPRTMLCSHNAGMPPALACNTAHMPLRPTLRLSVMLGNRYTGLRSILAPAVAAPVADDCLWMLHRTHDAQNASRSTADTARLFLYSWWRALSPGGCHAWKLLMTAG